MNVIFIIGAVQSLIFFFLLLNKNNRSSSDKILSTWFLIMALHLLVVYILTPEFLNLFPHFVGIQVGFPLLHGPFLFFYINSLVAGRSRIRTYDYLHIIPFVITLLVLIPFFSQSASEKLEIINGVRSYRNEYFIIIMQLSSGPAYIIWGLSLLRKHRILIGDQFSFTEKIELKWLNHLTIGLLLIWAVVILSNLTWELLKIQLPFDKEYIIYTSFSIFIFVIGYKGLKQGIIFIHIAEDAKVIISSRAKPKGPTIEEGAYDEKCQQIIQKLISYMDTEKPYLEEKLMLMDVAIHLNIPHYQLTKIFNDHLNTTFFNFINQYRVDYFKKRIVDPTNNAFTILAVAYDCGFASKASFNRIFKRFTNQTPSEFKHSLK